MRTCRLPKGQTDGRTGRTRRVGRAGDMIAVTDTRVRPTDSDSRTERVRPIVFIERGRKSEGFPRELSHGVRMSITVSRIRKTVSLPQSLPVFGHSLSRMFGPNDQRAKVRPLSYLSPSRGSHGSRYRKAVRGANSGPRPRHCLSSDDRPIAFMIRRRRRRRKTSNEILT